MARLDEGLKVTVTAPDGSTVTTDMVKSVGGTDTAPSAGWLYRAALASSNATLIAMGAARAGIELTSLEVTVDSESNDYGILGIDESVPPGPLSVRTRVRVGAKNSDEATVRKALEWGMTHSTVADATKRAVPMTLEVEITS